MEGCACPSCNGRAAKRPAAVATGGACSRASALRWRRGNIGWRCVSHQRASDVVTFSGHALGVNNIETRLDRAACRPCLVYADGAPYEEARPCSNRRTSSSSIAGRRPGKSPRRHSKRSADYGAADRGVVRGCARGLPANRRLRCTLAVSVVPLEGRVGFSFGRHRGDHRNCRSGARATSEHHSERWHKEDCDTRLYRKQGNPPVAKERRIKVTGEARSQAFNRLILARLCPIREPVTGVNALQTAPRNRELLTDMHLCVLLLGRRLCQTHWAS